MPYNQKSRPFIRRLLRITDFQFEKKGMSLYEQWKELITCTWVRRMDSHHRSSGYGPDEFTTALPRNVYRGCRSGWVMDPAPLRSRLALTDRGRARRDLIHKEPEDCPEKGALRFFQYTTNRPENRVQYNKGGPA